MESPSIVKYLKNPNPFGMYQRKILIRMSGKVIVGKKKVTFFYLPDHPNLIYEWLSQHFDIGQYLRKKKKEIESKLSVPEVFWAGKIHCRPLGIHVTLSVQEVKKSFMVTPSMSQLEKYKQFLETD